MKFCPNCGTNLESKVMKFCPECGEKLTRNDDEVSSSTSQNETAEVAIKLLNSNGFQVYSEGVFNVEGGKANIESRIFKACECESGIRREIPCEDCGRSTSNSKTFRAGPGDGMYKVWTIYKKQDGPSTVDDIFGALILFDYGITNLKSLTLNEVKLPKNLELYNFGDIEIDREISIGESGAQIRVEGRLGKYRVLTFCEIDPEYAVNSESKKVAELTEASMREYGDSDLEAIDVPFNQIPLIVPYMALVIHPSVFNEDAIAWQQLLKCASKPDLVKSYFAQMSALENSNIYRIENIACYNNSLSSTWSKDEQVSWLLQGREIDDKDCIDLLNKEIAAGYELTLAKEIELLCRRGYIWVAEEKFEASIESGVFDTLAANTLAENCLFVNREYEKAKTLLDRVFNSEKGFEKFRAASLLITCLGNLGRLDDAIKMHKECLRLAISFEGLELPLSADAGVRYGEILETSGHLNEALECFQNVANVVADGMPRRRAVNGIRRIEESLLDL
jgi:tetratricopeptide (TPR) repeat protein